jgi:hypothetical protein
MKIGILTYQRAHNYGALLQAFALKTYVQNLGHKVELIDYWPKYHSLEYELIPYFSKRSFLGKIKSILLLSLLSLRIIKRRAGYINFMRSFLGLSKNIKYKLVDELANVNFDIILYGSDQIWRKHNNPLLKGFDSVYYGEGVSKKIKKVSYAASMGVLALSTENNRFLSNHLGEFKNISVRESNLQFELENRINCKSSLVLDPVFLLDKDVWIKYIPNSLVSEKYIFLYQLKEDPSSIILAQKLQDYFGYRVIEVKADANTFSFGNRYKHSASPFEFLSLIKNAEFVVSTSFHGTAFSVIFEKQFYAIGMGNNSDRVRTLLNTLGISTRLLYSVNDINYDDIIDYNKVKENLVSSIDLSMSFVKENLN